MKRTWLQLLMVFYFWTRSAQDANITLAIAYAASQYEMND